MKLVWLCNMIPGEVQEKLSGKPGSGFWIDHVLSDLRKMDVRIHILARGGTARGELDGGCSYALFPAILPERYSAEQEELFFRELKSFQPDVIHIWGSEYGHTLAMVNAAQRAGMLERTVIGMQGLCSLITLHYTEGIPAAVCRSYTFRDFVKRNNILGQQKVFARRGELETQALQKVSHVIGRTHWDRAAMEAINPAARYHFCNETLREPFYEGAWRYDDCRKHRIFASSCAYPVKGFHYLLEAFAQVLKRYPDATLAVPGKDFRTVDSWKRRLRESSYDRYLRQLVGKYHLEDRIEILGSLDPEQMKAQYLMANVFVLPSTIENSPNSMGEAMLLGVPCVAADVGGVSTMLTHNTEGFLYQSTGPYVLAHYIGSVFEMREQAESMGRSAAAHARRTHDPEKNLEDLLRIYRTMEN